MKTGFDMFMNHINLYSLGKPVYDQSGELVCLKPFPSMPVYFWNDKDGMRYKKAYFGKYKGRNFIYPSVVNSGISNHPT